MFENMLQAGETICIRKAKKRKHQARANYKS